MFRRNNTNSIEVDISEENTYISITAKEGAVLGLRISEDDSFERTTTNSLPVDSSNISENSEEDNNTSTNLFDRIFAEDWNQTDVPRDIANHAFELAIKQYIEQYYIPAISPYTSYEYIMENNFLVWEPIELVESARNPGYYVATMDLWFNPELEEVGYDFRATENFEYRYDYDTGYVSIFGKSWDVFWGLLDRDFTDDPNHMTLNMTNLPTDVIFDVATMSCLCFIEDIVLPDVGMASLDEFNSNGCTWEYEIEGPNGIRIIQIGDISYSLSMWVYVDACTEEFYVMGEEPIYYEDVTIYFEAENVGQADQSLTALYFSWSSDVT